MAQNSRSNFSPFDIDLSPPPTMAGAISSGLHSSTSHSLPAPVYLEDVATGIPQGTYFDSIPNHPGPVWDYDWDYGLIHSEPGACSICATYINHVFRQSKTPTPDFRKALSKRDEHYRALCDRLKKYQSRVTSLEQEIQSINMSYNKPRTEYHLLQSDNERGFHQLQRSSTDPEILLSQRTRSDPNSPNTSFFGSPTSFNNVLLDSPQIPGLSEFRRNEHAVPLSSTPELSPTHHAQPMSPPSAFPRNNQPPRLARISPHSSRSPIPIRGTTPQMGQDPNPFLTRSESSTSRPMLVSSEVRKSNPRLSDPDEDWYYHLYNHPTSWPKGIRKDSNNRPYFPDVHANRTVARMKPGDEHSRWWRAYDECAFDLLSVPGNYAKILAQNCIQVRDVVQQRRMELVFEGEEPSITVDGIARHFAECGLSVEEVVREFEPWAKAYRDSLASRQV